MLLERLAPAKINLGLHILRRRADGYHDLETVFLRLPWADRLTVRPAAGLSLSCSDPALPTDEGNLCMQAALLLARTYGVTAGAALHLDKRLPYGAGLGSGSSDAAATLLLLAECWGLAVLPPALHELAAALGSDVPFFLGPPAALGTGRGEHLAPLLESGSGQPYRCPFTFVVVVPPVHIATAAAYRRVKPRAGHRPAPAEVVASNDLTRWRDALVNDFEAPLLAHYPAVAAAKAALTAAGAGYAALSGSGSAVFGVFEDEAAAEAAAEAVQGAGRRVWWGRSST